jgi:adapter protein MecA 1/2
MDIEERGFSKDEVWLDRERSEELFWELIDEAHLTEEFISGDPLWIQVQALDTGIEVVVTKAVLSKDGKKVEINLGEHEKNLEIPFLPLDEEDESELEDEEFYESAQESNEQDNYIISVKNLEDLIAMSHAVDLPNLFNTIYSYNEQYYVYVEFTEESQTEKEILQIISLLLEYGQRSKLTVHVLEEYGKKIYGETALSFFKSMFPIS